MLKALVLDYSGVLYAKAKPASMHDFALLTEERYDLPRGAFRDASAAARAVVGDADDSKELLAEVERRLSESHGRAIENLHKQWRQLRREAKVDLTANIEIARALRGRMGLAVLANSDGSAEARLQKQGIRHLFDVVVDSAVAGVEKPNAAAYLLVAERLGVAVEECVFVDDHEENVEGARAAGMTAIHFDYNRDDDLAQQLAAAGVIVPTAVTTLND